MLKKRSIPDNYGFSLVEMMIVVAVTGLLAVIGISQYSKFKQRTRETEAKGALSALFTAERTFQSEYGFYHTNLQAIGYSMEGTMFFNVGFGNPTNLTPADYGFVSPLNNELGEINTRAQCTGYNGTGTDPSCRLATNVPNLPLVSTTFEDVFIATASTDPAAYADNDLAPTEGNTSFVEMIAQTVLQPTPANAEIPLTLAICQTSFDNPVIAAVIVKRCIAEDIIPRPTGLPINIQLWAITSRKSFKPLTR